MACSQLKIPVQRPYVDSNWHLYPLRVPAKFRRALFDRLRKREIGVQVNYLPAHLHPVFTKHGYKKGNYPIAENFYEEEISIPMHINITDIQVSDIAQQIIKQLEDLLN
jgi:dTDP-4-amino-4,6-dideoxygalactose transaminase